MDRLNSSLFAYKNIAHETFETPQHVGEEI